MDGSDVSTANDDMRLLLQSQNNHSLRWGKANVNIVRKAIVDTQIFKLQNESQLMCEWLKDAKRYNNGAALEVEFFFEYRNV